LVEVVVEREVPDLFWGREYTNRYNVLTGDPPPLGKFIEILTLEVSLVERTHFSDVKLVIRSKRP